MTETNLSIEPAEESMLDIQQRNKRYVQIDAVGIGLANAASPFLPVFLTRLNATSTQVGLLSSMPGITGLLLAIPIGRFLQSRKYIVPWFSLARLLVVSSYALTGLIPFLVPREIVIPMVLLIWAFATLPQTMVAVCFSVVMNSVAGPEGRFDLMSRRWSILGLTSALSVAIVGWLLDRINFPINYQVVFLGLSLGGLISYYFSSRIQLPPAQTPPPKSPDRSLINNIRTYVALIRSEPAFVSFTLKRFVFLSGIAFAAPLFPLYYVREVHASDAWIGIISTAQTFVLVVGYLLWVRLTHRKGSRFVLLVSTLGMSVYPALVASTHNTALLVVFAGVTGIFQAGVDLVFFDELMKTVPPEFSPTFVSLAQSIQYLSAIFAPLIGTFLAEHIGLSNALIISAVLRLVGFILFACPNRR
jgi:MFS family permease